MAKQNETKILQDKFINELSSLRSAGNVLVACQMLGFARSTVYYWRVNNEEFAKRWEAAILDSFELKVDEAENALRLAVTKDRNITAIIFTLKALKPERYGDKIKLEHRGEMQGELKPDFVDSIVRLGKKLEANHLTSSDNP